jgi:hypothetical protein
MRAANLNESLNSAWRDNGRLQRAWRWLAIAWLLVLVGLGVQQWQLWSKESRIDTDILALLPQDAHDRLLSDVTRRIADANSRQVVVLLGSADAAQTKAAELAFRKELLEADGKHWSSSSTAGLPLHAAPSSSAWKRVRAMPSGARSTPSAGARSRPCCCWSWLAFRALRRSCWWRCRC